MNAMKLVGILGGVFSLKGFRLCKENKKSAICTLNHSVSAEEWDANWDALAPCDCEGQVVCDPKVSRGILFICPRMKTTSAKEQQFNDALYKAIKSDKLIKEYLDRHSYLYRIVTSTLPEAKRFSKRLLQHAIGLPSSSCCKLIEEEALNDPQIGYEEPKTANFVLPCRSFRDRSSLELFFRENIYRPDGENSNTLDIYVGSPNAYKFLITRALQLPLHAWNRFHQAEGSYGYFKIFGDGRVILHSVGSLTHLPNITDNVLYAD